MKYLFIILSALFIYSCKSDKASSSSTTTATETSTPKNNGPVVGVKLTKLWESDSTLMTTESVLHDPATNMYYVSCIGNVPPNKEDGDGYIVVLDDKGNTAQDKWARGLDAPKGMAIKGNELFVTDINDFVIIDKQSGEIKKKINVPGATFLNDVAIAPDGIVYFTDSDQNTIYMYDEKEVTIFKKDKGLGGTNGIFVDDETMTLAGFGNGDVHTIDIESKKITKRGDGIVPGGDGVVPYEGGFLMSNWNGEVYFVNPSWEATKVLDTKTQKANAADISMNTSANTLLVPTFFDNRVVAYIIENQY